MYCDIHRITCRSKIYAMIAQRMGGVKWKYTPEQFLYHTRSSVILLLSWLSGKESVCQCLSMQEAQVQSLGRKDLWGRKWQPIPAFLPGKSHEQRSLVGYSPRGCKESDMTERLNNNKIMTKLTCKDSVRSI